MKPRRQLRPLLILVVRLRAFTGKTRFDALPKFLDALPNLMPKLPEKQLQPRGDGLLARVLQHADQCACAGDVPERERRSMSRRALRRPSLCRDSPDARLGRRYR